ncbi:MAG TPA: hypothetical protein VFL66_07485 [Gaiellaceae bacterium]|nr:hypothetical protein [Gaiellaceae bacterium]
MSRKRIKQYLMLLTTAGIIAVVAQGSGTFASFNAEVQHNGNTFATGTLLLHATSNGTTCASESDANNSNLVSNGCTVLFNGVQIGSPATGTLDAAGDISAGTVTSIVADLTGSADIEPGDLIKLSNNSTSDTFTATAEVAPASDVTIPVVSQATSNTYSHTNTTVAVQTYTQFANIQLANAGTLDAGDIKFSFPSCSNSASQVETLGTTSVAVSSGILTLDGTGSAFGAAANDTIEVGSDSYTLTQAVSPGDVQLHVNPTSSSAYPASTPVTYAPFAGNGGGTLCSSLRYAIIETPTSAFVHDDSVPGGATCAYGDSTDGSSGIGCSFGSGTYVLSGAATDTPLSINNGNGGNASGQLTKSKSRYFVVGIQANVAGFQNTDQNQTASFALKWHIDQA